MHKMKNMQIPKNGRQVYMKHRHMRNQMSKANRLLSLFGFRKVS